VSSHTQRQKHVGPLSACTPPTAPAASSYAATPQTGRKRDHQHTVVLGSLETGRCRFFLFWNNINNRYNNNGSRPDAHHPSSYRTVATCSSGSLPNFYDDTQPSPPLNIGTKVFSPPSSIAPTYDHG
jgi:hypothetical protein